MGNGMEDDHHIVDYHGYAGSLEIDSLLNDGTSFRFIDRENGIVDITSENEGFVCTPHYHDENHDSVFPKCKAYAIRMKRNGNVEVINLNRIRSELKKISSGKDVHTVYNWSGEPFTYRSKQPQGKPCIDIEMETVMKDYLKAENLI